MQKHTLNKLILKLCSLRAQLHNNGIQYWNRVVWGTPILRPGQLLYSVGGTFIYRVQGACCRLYDREELPWPCCRLSWKGKEPSWRRIGRRLIPDLATKKSPSYVLVLLDKSCDPVQLTTTLYWMELDSRTQHWWFTCPRSRSYFSHST